MRRCEKCAAHCSSLFFIRTGAAIRDEPEAVGSTGTHDAVRTRILSPLVHTRVSLFLHGADSPGVDIGIPVSPISSMMRRRSGSHALHDLPQRCMRPILLLVTSASTESTAPAYEATVAARDAEIALSRTCSVLHACCLCCSGCVRVHGRIICLPIVPSASPDPGRDCLLPDLVTILVHQQRYDGGKWPAPNGGCMTYADNL